MTNYSFGGYDLSAMSATQGDATIYNKLVSVVAGLGQYVLPHHPIQCYEWVKVELDEEGMRCPHAQVDILEEKLQAAINYSICELLMELVREKYT